MRATNVITKLLSSCKTKNYVTYSDDELPDFCDVAIGYSLENADEKEFFITNAAALRKLTRPIKGVQQSPIDFSKEFIYVVIPHSNLMKVTLFEKENGDIGVRHYMNTTDKRKPKKPIPIFFILDNKYKYRNFKNVEIDLRSPKD